MPKVVSLGIVMVCLGLFPRERNTVAVTLLCGLCIPRQ